MRLQSDNIENLVEKTSAPLVESAPASVIQTLQSVFDDASERTSHPSHDEMARQDFAGVILVRLESFQPRLACHQGFWSATCTATTDISLGVEVNGPRGRLLGTSVGSSKTFDGDAGAACGDAANVFAESYRLALRDALERLTERVSNAPRLRAAADGSRRDSLREGSAP